MGAHRSYRKGYSRAVYLPVINATYLQWQDEDESSMDTPSNHASFPYIGLDGH